MHLSDSFDYQALSIVVGMFNAASGAEVHQELRDYLESGDSPTTVVRNLLQTDAFQTLFPTQLSDAEFSSKFAFSLLGDEVSFPQLVEATFTLSGLLNAHMPREDVIWLAINALLSVPPENSSWIAARVAFESKIAVAEYYSVEKSKPSNSLEELQEVLKGVTADSKSVDDAIRIIDGNPLTSDEPDTSEEPDPSSDTTVYISSSDPSQVLWFDLGDGEDTVNITDSNGASIDLSSIEILNAEIFRLLSSSGLFNGLLSVNAPAWQSLTDVFVELQSPAESQAIELPDALSTATIVARGAETLSIEGGSGNLSVTNGDAPINVGVANGGAFTSVNVSGGSLVTIVDQRIENGNPVIQTGLTNVTLDGNTTVANLTGDGITTLTLLNDSVGAVLTNTTPNHALSLHTSNLSIGALVDDQSAGSVSINTSGGASIVSLDTPSAQLVTLTGDADLTLIDLSMSLSTLDAGAFTGNLNLTANSSSSPMTITDGSGDDVLNLVAVSGALTVHNGEGNDSVTTGGGDDVIYDAAGDDSYTTGQGNDQVYLGGGFNTIEGGEGNDTVIFDDALGVSSDVLASLLTTEVENAVIRSSEGFTSDAADLSGLQDLQNVDVRFSGSTSAQTLTLPSTVDNIYLEKPDAAMTLYRDSSNPLGLTLATFTENQSIAVVGASAHELTLRFARDNQSLIINDPSASAVVVENGGLTLDLTLDALSVGRLTFTGESTEVATTTLHEESANLVALSVLTITGNQNFVADLSALVQTLTIDESEKTGGNSTLQIGENTAYTGSTNAAASTTLTLTATPTQILFGGQGENDIIVLTEGASTTTDIYNFETLILDVSATGSYYVQGFKEIRRSETAGSVSLTSLANNAVVSLLASSPFETTLSADTTALLTLQLNGASAPINDTITIQGAQTVEIASSGVATNAAPNQLSLGGDNSVTLLKILGDAALVLTLDHDAVLGGPANLDATEFTGERFSVSSSTGTFPQQLTGSNTQNEFLLSNATVGLTVIGGDGADTISTGIGDDAIVAGTGTYTVHAGNGNDTITVKGGSGSIDGGEGTDSLVYEHSDTTTPNFLSQLTLSGVEVLSVVSDSTSLGALDLSAIDSMDEISVSIASSLVTTPQAIQVNDVVNTVTLRIPAAPTTLTGNGITTLNTRGNAVTPNAPISLVNNNPHALMLEMNGYGGGALISDPSATHLMIRNFEGAPVDIALSIAAAQQLSFLANDTAVSEGIITLQNSGADYSQLTTVTHAARGGLIADFSLAPVLVSVDASSSEGDNHVTLGVNTPGYAGGNGIDHVSLMATPTASTTGGGGVADILELGGTAQYNSHISDFEEIRFMTSVGGSYALDGVHRVQLGALSSSLTLTNLQPATLTLTASPGHAISASLATDTPTDTFTLVLSDSSAITAGTISLPNIETVQILSQKGALSSASTYSHTLSLNSPASTVIVSGDTRLVLTDNASTLTSLNASGMTAGGLEFISNSGTSSPQFTGSAFNDRFTLSGASVGYNVNGGDGNDIITTGSGSDTIYGGAGNDTINAGAGANTIYAGEGNDNVTLVGVNETVYDGSGSDSIRTRSASNQIFMETDTDLDSITVSNLLQFSSLDTVHNIQANDELLFITSTDYSASAGTFTHLNLGETATAEDYFDHIFNNNTGSPGARWFQTNGNTYLFLDSDSGTSFSPSSDTGIILSGTLDLSAHMEFNIVSGIPIFTYV